MKEGKISTDLCKNKVIMACLKKTMIDLAISLLQIIESIQEDPSQSESVYQLNEYILAWRLKSIIHYQNLNLHLLPTSCYP